MFSSLFGKRRSSPVEDETPPIPGPKTDERFVVVDPAVPGGSMYPSLSGGQPYSRRPAPAPPAPQNKNNTVDPSFHYLQGVPFSLSRELKLSTNKDNYTREVSDLLSFLMNRVKTDDCDYDFSIEKSVLKEC